MSYLRQKSGHVIKVVVTHAFLIFPYALTTETELMLKSDKCQKRQLGDVKKDDLRKVIETLEFLRMKRVFLTIYVYFATCKNQRCFILFNSNAVLIHLSSLMNENVKFNLF